MEDKEIYNYLCSYDPRSPEYLDHYETDNLPEPRTNCYCDCCFRSQDKLALEIIRLKELLETNNKLIAAAPELLEALIVCKDVLIDVFKNDNRACIKKAISVINLATNK